ncbi:zinc ribbon domain-containing protein [Zhongshania sp.]|uniref:Zn-ribbon domain-containing OB-fold protein n=1 Tax=Zhongshania sp. TaxID=1971902 RepID=UPI001B494E59|nr:zinc ribbon domain-containing protein [Zhongshania sp.]MBQ0794891.1 hypothetical protein [Zhongshania sp.]
MKGLGADQPYWDALSEGRVVMQRCEGCQKWNWPAVWRCGNCGSWEHAWHPRELKGQVFSWTRTWHHFGAPAELKPPFVTVVVTLDDTDERRLLGVLMPDSDDICIGVRVRGEVHKVHLEDEQIPAIRWSLSPQQTIGDSV